MNQYTNLQDLDNFIHILRHSILIGVSVIKNETNAPEAIHALVTNSNNETLFSRVPLTNIADIEPNLPAALKSPIDEVLYA